MNFQHIVSTPAVACLVYAAMASLVIHPCVKVRFPACSKHVYKRFSRKNILDTMLVVYLYSVLNFCFNLFVVTLLFNLATLSLISFFFFAKRFKLQLLVL